MVTRTANADAKLSRNSFETGSQPPPRLLAPSPRPESTIPSLTDLVDESTWLEWRSTALTPQIVTDLVSTDQSRAEFVEGARLLRLDAPGKHILPQQLVISDVLNAGCRRNGLLIPRRGTKTTSIQATLLGRCALREDYAVGWTLATTGQKASERFRVDLVAPMDRLYADPRDAPFRINRGKGSEAITWPHGSRFAVHAPVGESFRSGGYDVVWVDEAGEASPEMGEDLTGAIGPTLDTRPGAQLVFSGTAAAYGDSNLLFDALHRDGAGVLVYAFPADTTEDELADWEPSEEHPHARVRELIELSHPGVAAGLTPLEAVKDNFDDMLRERFGREYGGLFGKIGEGRGVFDAKAYADAAEDGEPDVPERFAMATIAAFNQGAGSIVAAWRDEEGRACGYVLDHRKGTQWIADSAASKAKNHNLPIVYDTASGPMRIEVESLLRMRPKPRLEPQNTANVTAAAALLVREVNGGNARHWSQPAMNHAAEIAVRRSVGASAWALGRPPKDYDADISAMEGWALALRWYDENPQRAMLRPVISY